MKTVVLSILMAAGATLALPAVAQVAPNESGASMPSQFPTTHAPTDAGWGGMASHGDPGAVLVSYSFKAGVDALEANDFARAEQIFSKNIRYFSNDPTARFYMGVTKMNLGKWDEAKRYLRTPARDLRKDPEPKSHLGVTFVKLGDLAGANAQRAALVKMSEACNGTCKQSPDIASGIKMIDEALAEAALKD